MMTIEYSPMLLKEIEQFKAQIEKMKCCQNCKHSLQHEPLGSHKANAFCHDCVNKSNWEIAE